MVPSMARLACARLAPSHSCAFHLPSSVGGGWSDDDGYSSGSSDVNVAAALASFELVEMPVGAMIRPEWYNGSLTSMVAINDENCSICHEPLITGGPDEQQPAGVGPNAWVVACGNRHAFHQGCIARWNVRSKRCPECNGPLLLGDAAPPQPPQPPLNETLAAIQLAKDAQAAAIQGAKDAPTPAEAFAVKQKAQEALQEERAVKQAQKRATRQARREAQPPRPELARRAARAKKQREEEELEETLLWDIWHTRRMISREGGLVR